MGYGECIMNSFIWDIRGNHEQVYHLMRMANLMGKRPGEKGKPKSYRGCVKKWNNDKELSSFHFSFILGIRKNFL